MTRNKKFKPGEHTILRGVPPGPARRLASVAHGNIDKRN